MFIEPYIGELLSYERLQWIEATLGLLRIVSKGQIATVQAAVRANGQSFVGALMIVFFGEVHG